MVLERHNHDTLYQYFSDWNIFHVFKSGFRAKHSCQRALTKMMSTWLSAINDNKTIGVIFLDFRKAFDVVYHEILLKKLQTYGFGSCSLKWFSSYLSNRLYWAISVRSTAHLCRSTLKVNFWSTIVSYIHKRPFSVYKKMIFTFMR